MTLTLFVLPQFNLDIEEVDAAVRELEPWRRNITQPLVLEVPYSPHPPSVGEAPQL